MILNTVEGSHPRVNGSHPRSLPLAPDTPLQSALRLAADIAERYGISALSGLLHSATAAAAQEEISVAVLGRFKAGKSSFLNDFFGRAILPVGVVPVTAVVTEVRYGPRERARVQHSNAMMGRFRSTASATTSPKRRTRKTSKRST